MVASGDRLRVSCGEADVVARAVRGLWLAELEEIGSDQRVYVFKERLKETNGIYEKVRQKREAGQQEYAPSDVEDAWGCRFVTLFQAEIADVVSEIIDLVVAATDRRAPLRIRDIVVYSNRPRSDPLCIGKAVTSIVEDSTLPREAKERFAADALEHRDSGYSSVHLILECEVEIKQGRLPKKRTGVFEIQVRDIFEEAWSEISHKLAYKRRNIADTHAKPRKAEPGDPASRALQSRSLNALKASADACSQHATVFDRNMSYWLDSAGLEGKDLSVSSIEEDIDRITKAVVDDAPDAIEPIAAGYRMLQAAHTSFVRSMDNRQPRKFYETAAGKFEAAIDALGPELLGREVEAGGMPIEYYLRIEHANALWRGASETADQRGVIYKAVTIYEGLLKGSGQEHYARDATIPLRLAQALTALAGAGSDEDRASGHVFNWLSSARSWFRQALARANDDPLLGDHEERRRWLGIEAERGLGFVAFKLADMEPVSGARLAALDQVVIEATRVADGIEGLVRYSNGFLASAHKCIGNLLYYHWVRHKARQAVTPSATMTAEERQLIETRIDQLMRRPFKRLIETHPETIDNIMVAASVIGDADTARLMAKKNEAKFREMAETRRDQGEEDVARRLGDIVVARYLDPAEVEMYRRAVNMLHPLADAAV